MPGFNYSVYGFNIVAEGGGIHRQWHVRRVPQVGRLMTFRRPASDGTRVLDDPTKLADVGFTLTGLTETVDSGHAALHGIPALPAVLSNERGDDGLGSAKRWHQPDRNRSRCRAGRRHRRTPRFDRTTNDSRRGHETAFVWTVATRNSRTVPRAGWRTTKLQGDRARSRIRLYDHHRSATLRHVDDSRELQRMRTT